VGVADGEAPLPDEFLATRLFAAECGLMAGVQVCTLRAGDRAEIDILLALHRHYVDIYNQYQQG